MDMCVVAAPGASLDLQKLFRLRHVARQTRRGIRPRHGVLPGTIVSRRRGSGLEIDDVRFWTHGDDTRHIDRNATARTGEPHVRTFRDEREHAVLLVADFRPSMLFGTRRAFRSVAAVEALVLVGWWSLAEGGRVGCLTLGAGEPHFARPGSSDRAMASVIGRFAAAHRAALSNDAINDLPLAALLEAAVPWAPRSGTVVLATSLDSPGDGFDAAVASLLYRASLCVVLARDVFERDPPPGDYPFVTTEGTRGWARVRSGGSGAPSVAERVGRLRGLGARVVPIDTDLEPEDMAMQLEGLYG